MDSVNEELAHVKEAYDTDSSSNILIEATQTQMMAGVKVTRKMKWNKL